ncbi:MAG: polyprenyl diphosphate synthase, partial [Alphaproteobacteria bacterium]
SGVSYLTLYGFSSENWKRPAQEVDDLMALLRRYLRSETAELHKNNVRLRFIGDRTPFAPDIIALIEQAEAQTRDNAALDLIVALNYGGRGEITGAARKLAERAQRGELEPAAVTEESFAACLSTSGIPDPDLVIRTSGEKRLSNFLLWQLAYAELVFVDTLWPDFGKDDFENVIREYHRRERRYGAVGR